MLHFLKLMIQLVLSPARGWEDVALSAGDPRRTLLRGLLPLVGIAAVSVFLGAFYQLRPSAGLLIVQAVITFIKYCATYFIGVAALTAVLPRQAIDGNVERPRVEIFCAYCVGLMALVGILENLLPMELTLLRFLPIYLVIIMFIGRTYLDVDERHIFGFIGVAVAGLILPVYLIDRILSMAV